MDELLVKCFYQPDQLETTLEEIRTLLENGDTLNEKTIISYAHMDKQQLCIPRLLQLIEECRDVLTRRQCAHDEFRDGCCCACGVSYDEYRSMCKHIWVPAGHKKNKDRIHNKGNGKGKYQAYKCQECGAFKRRYL